MDAVGTMALRANSVAAGSNADEAANRPAQMAAGRASRASGGAVGVAACVPAKCFGVKS